MNRIRLVLTTAAALVAAALVVPASAHADVDPAGTVILSSGPAAAPNAVVLAATPEAVLFSDQRGLIAQPRGASSGEVLSSGHYFDVSSAGSMVVYYDYSDRNKHWYDTATGERGLGSPSWGQAAPTGGLLVTSPGPAVARISVQDARSGALRDLADVYYPGSTSGVQVRSGPRGFVVSWARDDTSGAAPFVGYGSYDGGPLTSLDLSAVSAEALNNFSCLAPSTSTIACKAFGGGAIFAAPLSGAQPMKPIATTFGVSFAVSSTSVGWMDFAQDGSGTYRLKSVPRGGGTVTTASMSSSNYGMVSDGSAFVSSFGSTAADRGVYTTPSATQGPTLVLRPTMPYLAQGLALAPGGRVVFTDNRSDDAPLWQQTVAQTSDGFVAGNEVLLSTNAASQALAASGARTGFTSTRVGGSYTVVTARRGPMYLTASAALSGSRALLDDNQSIVDLNTGLSSPVPTPDAVSGALWGDYYTFVRSDWSVWRQNLATGGAAQRLLTAASQVRASSVRTWGDWVVVTRSVVNARTGQIVPQSTILNVAKGTSRRIGAVVIRVTPVGYATAENTLNSWDGANSVSVDGTALTAAESAMAWIGSDGRVRAAPVPWTSLDAPRSLGNPLAPLTVARNGYWLFDLPTSAPLASCSVEFSRGGTAIRTLPCDAGLSAGGDVLVGWDLRDAGGRRVQPATYTWRVVARGTNGPLELANGRSGTVSGKVTVTS